MITEHAVDITTKKAIDVWLALEAYELAIYKWFEPEAQIHCEKFKFEHLGRDHCSCGRQTNYVRHAILATVVSLEKS